MKKVRFLLSLWIVCIAFSCVPKVEPNVEFEEVRIHRWTALEGGETLVLRRVGSNWSAKLQGDGNRFSCFYQRDEKPKSDWNQFWNTLIVEGLMELSGNERSMGLEDGDGFDVEVTYQGKLRQYSVDNPTHQKSDNAKRILRIGDLISREFDSPMFVADYDRGRVGEYLIDSCRELKKQ